MPGTMQFFARQPMVVAASEEAVRLLLKLGLDVQLLAASGTAVQAGTSLLRAEGSAASLHMGWKTCQTLIEWASGIASAVQDIVIAATSVRPGIAVACTRKNVPLTRALSIKAVQAGGGVMHRTGLADSVLVFPEHRAFLADLDEAALVQRLRAGTPERKLTVEVVDLESALRMARAGADVLQLEKFPPAQVAELVASLAGLAARPMVAAAGGVNASNAGAYAAAGADILVTSAPYAAPPRDVQVRINAERINAQPA
jgi:molybdenum transport protein